MGVLDLVKDEEKGWPLEAVQEFVQIPLPLAGRRPGPGQDALMIKAGGGPLQFVTIHLA